MFRLRCPSIPRPRAGDVYESFSIQPVKSARKSEPQPALAILIDGVASKSEIGVGGLGILESTEVASVVAVYAMPRSANPNVAIPVLKDGVDFVPGQTWDVRKGGDRFAIPHT